MRTLLFSCLLLLGGCSTLSEDQCRSGDWYQLGYQDGQQGRTRSRLQAYGKSCQEYGIQPDGPQWQAGYEKGLERYCLLEFAYAKGRAGERYLGVCPLDASFRAEFERGHRVYELHRQVEQLQSELGKLHQEQDELWHHYRHTGDPHAREELRFKLRRLEWDERDLRDALWDARQQADAAD